MSWIVNRTRVLVNRNVDLSIGAIFFLVALALYLRTMPPTVMDGDSGEYQYMAFILGVPHSTGYPLYVLLAKLFTLFPIGDVAFRVNFFSVLCGALTAPLVYATARRVLPRHRRFAAIATTLIMIVTPSMWGGSNEAKTYSLHLLLGVFVIFLVLRWQQDGMAIDFYWLALALGFGLANHPVFRFLAPAPALVLWFNRARLNRVMVMRGALLILAPLLLYAYIPIRANQLIAQQDPANWALYGRDDAMLKGTVTAYYNNTPQGFFNLVTGLDNSYKIDVKSPLESSNRVVLSMTLLLQQFGLAGVGLAVVGAWISFLRDRRVFMILLTAAIGNGLIAFYLRGISTVYYFSLTYFVFAIWIGFCVDALLQWAEKIRRTTRSRWVIAFATPRAIVPVLLSLPFTILLLNFPRLDRSNYFAPRVFAQAVLSDNLASDAVVIAPWEVSQPLRYFQFVENQRPDLLVINVSPIWPQFQTLLASARNLHRPFYQVQFTPEFNAEPGYRWIQAIPLPLQESPHPRYQLRDARIVNEVEVLGYDLNPDPPIPGQPVRVYVYYRTLARMYPMYSAILSVGDLLGRPVGDYLGFPASYYYPTYRWQPGDFYRDGWSFIWPPDAPNGLFTLEMNWYIYDLESGKSDYDREFKLALGTIRAGNFSVPQKIARPQNVRFGDAITFLGWDSTPGTNIELVSITRGQSLAVDLFWRGERAVAEAYTVFVHLVDTNGAVVADADSPPSNGLYPTDRWNVGEAIRDRHTLLIRETAPPGKYFLEIGIYNPATGKRVTIESGSARADKIVLAQVNVR